MRRDGWVFLGWTLEQPAGAGDFNYTVADADAYKATTGVYPNDPILYGPYSNYGTNVSAGETPYLTDTAGMVFVADDITLYAVWGIDENGTGKPDWEDEYGRQIKYYLSLSSVIPSTVPFSGNNNVDDNGGAGYAYNQTVQVSSDIPEADGYIFLGWSPVFIGGTEFGYGPGQQSLQEFYSLLCLLEDIRKGDDISGNNDVVNMGGGTGGTAVRFGGTDEVKYDLASGFESIYADMQTDFASGTFTTPGDYYGNGSIDWVSLFASGNYNFEGFISKVTFDAFVATMDAMGNGAPPSGADEETWMLYGIWAADMNHNGLPDIFEESLYTLLRQQQRLRRPRQQILQPSGPDCDNGHSQYPCQAGQQCQQYDFPRLDCRSYCTGLLYHRGESLGAGYGRCCDIRQL